jgi:hypothetical protein
MAGTVLGPVCPLQTALAMGFRAGSLSTYTRHISRTGKSSTNCPRYELSCRLIVDIHEAYFQDRYALYKLPRTNNYLSIQTAFHLEENKSNSVNRTLRIAMSSTKFRRHFRCSGTAENAIQYCSILVRYLSPLRTLIPQEAIADSNADGDKNCCYQ